MNELDVNNETLAGGSRSERTRRVHVALSTLFALNAAWLYVFAMSNAGLFGDASRSFRSAMQISNLLMAQSILFLLPGLLVGISVSWVSLRAATILGSLCITVVMPLYYLDFTMHRIFSLRLLSLKTWELVFLVLSRAGEFVLQTNLWSLFAPVLIYLVVQSMFLRVSWWAGGRAPSRIQTAALRGCACFSTLALALGAVRVLTAPTASSPFLPVHDPHPIHLTGIFDTRPKQKLTNLDRRCIAQLVSFQGRWQEVEEGYRNLSVTASPGAQPDVIMFVLESLRHDAITARAAPNLSQLAQESLVSRVHFSSGNATHMGYFGIMYGLNLMWYERAKEKDTAPALPALMRELGYHTAFLGSWEIDSWAGMDRFLNDRRFDQFDILPLGESSYVEGDQAVLDRAQRMLKREGEFQSLGAKPLFLLLQLNSTHYEFHSEPQDQIFQPSTITIPPWNNRQRVAVANRYANSVHCVDRLIAPLLDRRRVLLLTGDHGESFGEDGLYLHSSALSRAQLQTPFLLYVPGRPAADLREPTSHVDILPTLVDALGGTVDHGHWLHGRSLLRSPTDSTLEAMIFRTFGSEKYAAILRTAGMDADETPIHFEGNVFTADFRVHGCGSLADGSLITRRVEEEHFSRVFQHVFDQMYGGHSPPLPQDAYTSLVESSQKGDESVRILAIRKLGELGPWPRHRKDDIVTLVQ